MKSFLTFIQICLLTSLTSNCSQDIDLQSERFEKIEFTEKMASGFANMALKCVEQEYPNKLNHVINDLSEVKNPKLLHPAFFGCFDWHSSVHGHWMLVKLLSLFPGLPESTRIRDILDENLKQANIETEIQYFKQNNRKSFERTYGWAWLLKLTEELYKFKDSDSQIWYKNLKPLADIIVEKYLNYLPKQTYAIRTGVHPNTAFGLSFALDYAQIFNNIALKELILQKGRAFFLKDRNYPAQWEPGGEDFFSASLQEADFMRRILPQNEFEAWFTKFLPDFTAENYKNLLVPAIVTDRSDPKIVHLDGLNLSRAWCMIGIKNSLRDNSVVENLTFSANKHASQALEHLDSGNYEGGHWLCQWALENVPGAGS